MEGHHMMEGHDEIMMLREQRRQLKEKIEAQHQNRNREDYMDTLSIMVPDLVSSLELSLKVASTVGGLLQTRDRASERQVLSGTPRADNHGLEAAHRGRMDYGGGFYGGGYKGGDYGGMAGRTYGNGTPDSRGMLWGPIKANGEVDHHGGVGSRGGENWMGDTGIEGFRRGQVGALGFVKQMVAACLLAPITSVPIDSTGLHRRLAKNPTPAERDALNEVGGEGGGVAAIEAALTALGGGPNPAVDIEEFFVSGKQRRLMVLAFDRPRLMKELPSPPLHHRMGVDSGGGNPHLMGIVMGPGMEPNGGMMGMGPGPPRPDMWGGGGEPHMQGGPPMPGPPPMYPGGPPMMGRGGPPPRGMGMMGMAPGPGVPGLGMGYGGMPPFQRPLGPGLPHPNSKMRGGEEDEMKDLEMLLTKKSYKELQQSKTGEELLELIHRPTAKETAVAAKFKTKGGSALKEYCPSLTKEDCRCHRGSYIACEKVHFRRIIALHTDISLGDCSFLDTCRHMKTCKYVHYELDPVPDVPNMMMGAPGLPPPPRPLSRPQRAHYCSDAELGEPQWINCDIRNFRMDVLGQFGVIMADPPWDIHMELPYGTMADDEMRNLNVPALQTDGLIFLWVTGRAMELGRECLELWGYRRVEEIIWVKTNQLQRIIRTGRTGHWLNHSKEHCLVGIKGNPEVNRNIDTDVIVAEVRETSRKPDEMYPLLERISPRTRKLELFARMHNTHAGWISLGNQLNGVRLVDEGLRARFKAAYPETEVQPPDPTSKSSGDGESTAQTKSPPGQHATKVDSTEATASAEEKVVSSDVDMVS